LCGICGFTWDDENLIRYMGKSIQHRGPEQEGFYIDENVSLCCERLKILDLSAQGKQPLHNEDSSIWVVLNGEIYNFQEVKNQLKSHHQFYTNTDTEVILHAYEEFGENCVEKLNGMFAFAIWDTIKKKLIIYRDRIGVKPLYYFVDKNNNLSFASEIKSLLQNNEIKPELNSSALSQLITYAYTIDGQTMFKGINELLPGHKLVYSFEDKSIQIEQYWDLTLNETDFDENYYLKKLEQKLEDSINDRFVSDAPLGALLSGGLDSSVMVAIMNKLSNEPIKTFTSGFGHELDEYDEAKIVAEHCGTDHKEIELTYKDLSKNLPTILWHMEFPFGRPSILPNFLMSKEIKKFVTVVYTGEGSDELFAGYNRYLIYHENNSQTKLQENLLSSITSGFFPDPKINSQIFSSDVLITKNNQNHPINAFGQFSESNTGNLLNKALLFEFKTEIPGAQTWRIDRAGSAYAVELREPFLDYRLAEFCFSIPAKFKMNNFNGLSKKYILQKLANTLLPSTIVKRKKFPWGIPFFDFFKTEFLPIAQNLLDKAVINRRTYLNLSNSYVSELCNKVIVDKAGTISSKNIEINDRILRQILFLFNLELWHQLFIEENNFKNPSLSLDRFV